MKVLSLFDGISCGRLALERARIPVERYFAMKMGFYIKIAKEQLLKTKMVLRQLNGRVAKKYTKEILIY